MDNILNFNADVTIDMKAGKLPLSYTDILLKEKIDAFVQKREPNYLKVLATCGLAGACDYAIAKDKLIRERLKALYR